MEPALKLSFKSWFTERHYRSFVIRIDINIITTVCVYFSIAPCTVADYSLIGSLLKKKFVHKATDIHIHGISVHSRRYAFNDYSVKRIKKTKFESCNRIFFYNIIFRYVRFVADGFASNKRLNLRTLGCVLQPASAEHTNIGRFKRFFFFLFFFASY